MSFTKVYFYMVDVSIPNSEEFFKCSLHLYLFVIKNKQIELKRKIYNKIS